MVSRHLAAPLLLAAAALTSCATVDRRAPFAEFRAGRYSEARAWYESAIAERPQEEALEHVEAGTVALVQGDVDAAHRHFLEGFAQMEDLSSTSGETVGAMLGPERSKRWRGDPYERCMGAYYLGLTYWMRGDPNDAAAAFKAGLLRDADSQKGAAQSDFALLWFLLGQAQREASHEDHGAAALATAAKLVPSNPWLDPAKNADANVVVVLDLGVAPEKLPAGPHGAAVRFERRPYAASRALVSADGVALGRTSRVLDVLHEALTRGVKVLDRVNQGKAIFKDAAVVGGTVVLSQSHSRESDLIGLGLLAAGLLLPAEADVRQWATLPGEVHVLSAKLPPGEHTLSIDVENSAGARLADESRTLRVSVRESHTTLVWSRAAPAERSAAGIRSEELR